MNTYTGETRENKPGGANVEETDSVEDLFLPGGFDSFGGMPESANTNIRQLGSVDYGNTNIGQFGSVNYGNTYGTVDNTLNRWSEPSVILNFGEQIANSFMPLRYDRYKGIAEGTAKEFVKDFTRLYVRAAFLILAVMMLMSAGNLGGGILIPVIVLGVFYALSVFLEPFIYRLRAFVYRLLFGKLLMIITKSDITSNNMYLVSIYACVPCMVVNILFTAIMVLAYFSFPVLLYLVSSISWLFSLIQLVLPVIIMGIAIPKMK